jgi:hypothetical protein
MSDHRGIYIGAATRSHGMSRQHHSVISTDVGGHVFTEEKIDLPSGTRVAFDLRTGNTTETLAVDVKPIDIKSANEPQPEAKPEIEPKPAKRRGDK